MKYKYIIFDFDGTLFNSRVGIVGGVKFALDYLNIEHPNEEVLTSFIGPPLIYSFKKHFNFTDDIAETAVIKLREYYNEKGALESIAYEGIENLLKALRSKNVKIGIATAKPTVYAHHILEYNDWSHYFDTVRGSDLEGELFPKEKTIGEVLADFNVYEKQDAIMIGDTIYDIKGAQEKGIDSIAVDYGFGKTQDIKDARPTYFVETVDKLSKILLHQ